MVIVLLLLLLPFTAAQWEICGTSGNFTSNSTYQANLALLSTTLPKKASSNTTLFATDSVGTVPDTVYALALCRGDTDASTCANCVATAFQDAQQLCVFNKDATLYYDSCLLRFSNKNFLVTTVNDNMVILMNTQNFTSSVSLLLFTLVNSTAQSAASSLRRFTTAQLDGSSASVPTLYCLMQCTPDLNASECAACFQDFPQLTLQYLDGRRGGRVVGVRCNMRYEIYPFFQGVPTLRIINLAPSIPAINNTNSGTPVTVYPQPGAAAPPPEAKTAAPEKRGRPSKLWVVAIAAPLLAVLLCFTFSFVWIRRRRKGKGNLQDEVVANRLEEDALVWRPEEKSSEFSLFDFSDILDATNNFSKGNQLGQGGFGPVYKVNASTDKGIAR